MTKKKTAFSFEESLTELEQLVIKLERGDTSLEDSLQAFERGINLTRTCQKALLDAEQKVHVLIDKNGRQVLETFPNE
jgi:exodeoxyribonuclease VII small subunit